MEERSYLLEEALIDAHSLRGDEDKRDYAEEDSWRHYCPACDSSPCISEQNEQEECEQWRYLFG